MAPQPTTKERFLAFIADQGWVPDPSQTLSAHPHAMFGLTPEQQKERVQNPRAFMRPAKHGGTWKMMLEYNRSGYRREYGKVLKSVHITHVDEAGEVNSLGRVGTLKNVDNQSYAKYNAEMLWTALREFKPNGDSESLVEVARKLVANPDLAIWLGIQRNYDHDEAVRKAREATEAQRRAEAQPLPIEVDRENWQRLASRLERAALAVRRANGTSNLSKLVTETALALEAVTSVLNDEALEIHQADLAEAHDKLSAQDQQALREFLQA